MNPRNDRFLLYALSRCRYVNLNIDIINTEMNIRIRTVLECDEINPFVYNLFTLLTLLFTNTVKFKDISAESLNGSELVVSQNSSSLLYLRAMKSVFDVMLTLLYLYLNYTVAFLVNLH